MTNKEFFQQSWRGELSSTLTALKALLLADKLDEKTWNEQIVPLKIFDNTIGEYPLSATCWMFMHDIIHHRGQLSTYYRPMGITQPSIYGPTAEMVEEMMAKMTSAN